MAKITRIKGKIKMGIPQPAFYILKCEQSAPPGFPKPSCVTPANQGLFQHLAQKLMEKGIIATVQPVRTGCLNRCQFGPVMLVEPGHFMYGGLDEEKINRIIDEHVIGGNVVEEYLLPKDVWDEPMSVADVIAQTGAR